MGRRPLPRLGNGLGLGDGREIQVGYGHMIRDGLFLRLRNILRLRRRNLLGPQNLIGGGNTGAAVEKALLLPGFLPHQGAVLHRNVDGGPGGPSRDGLLPALTLRPALPTGSGLGLRLIAGTAEKPVRRIQNRAVEGGQPQQQPGQQRDNGGPDFGEQGDKALAQNAAQPPSGL